MQLPAIIICTILLAKISLASSKIECKLLTTKSQCTYSQKYKLQLSQRQPSQQSTQSCTQSLFHEIDNYKIKICYQQWKNRLKIQIFDDNTFAYYDKVVNQYTFLTNPSLMFTYKNVGGLYQALKFNSDRIEIDQTYKFKYHQVISNGRKQYFHLETIRRNNDRTNFIIQKLKLLERQQIQMSQKINLLQQENKKLKENLNTCEKDTRSLIQQQITLALAQEEEKKKRIINEMQNLTGRWKVSVFVNDTFWGIHEVNLVQTNNQIKTQYLQTTVQKKTFAAEKDFGYGIREGQHIIIKNIRSNSNYRSHIQIFVISKNKMIGTWWDNSSQIGTAIWQLI